MPELSLGTKFIGLFGHLPGPGGRAAAQYVQSKLEEQFSDLSNFDFNEHAKAGEYNIFIKKLQARGYSLDGATEIAQWAFYRPCGMGPATGRMSQSDALLWTNYLQSRSMDSLPAIQANFQQLYIK